MPVAPAARRPSRGARRAAWAAGRTRPRTLKEMESFQNKRRNTRRNTTSKGTHGGSGKYKTTLTPAALR